MKKVAVIGLGYVGLEVALSASSQYQVVGFDLNEDKVSMLQRGISYIEDISNEKLSNSIQNKSFTPSNNPNKIKGSDVVVICVPTPLDEKRNPDMSFLELACNVIAENLEDPALVINESTSYPGTLREFIKTNIEKQSIMEHQYASSPERVDPGNKEWNIRKTPRLISGLTKEATLNALKFYGAFSEKLIEVDLPEVAEAAKLFENTFRQVNIALVNELAIICHALRIDCNSVINAASTKPYGFMKFNPGPGVGGHCIPVDPSYLAFKAEEAGVSARFIELANQVNLDMPKYVISRCEELLSNFSGKKVLIAGVSYKADISDVRETPAELLYQLVIEKGAEVAWFDPLVDSWKPGKIIEFNDNQYDLVIFQAVHSVFDLDKLKSAGKEQFDCTGKVPGVTRI